MQRRDGYHDHMPDRPVTRILTRRQSAGRLLERRPDLSVDRTQRRRARELAASHGNRAGVVAVLAAWLEVNPDSDVRDLSLALADRLQMRLVSVPARSRTEDVIVAARIDEAFELGWERLDGDGAAAILSTVAVAGGAPVPRELALRATGLDDRVVNEVVQTGFATLDGAGCLAVDGSTLTFLEQRRVLPGERFERQLAFAFAVRDLAVTLPPARTELDDLAEAAQGILAVLRQPMAAVSLCHRMAERLRRRGDLPGAMAWVEQGRARASELGDAAAPLRGLLALDEACIVLGRDGPVAAMPACERAVALLSTPHAAEAEPALQRARLLRAQLLASTRAEAPEDQLAILADSLEGPARAVALQTLGSAELRRGDRIAAREHLRQARALVEGLGADETLAALLVAEAQALHPVEERSAASALLERARVLAGGDLDRPPTQTLPLALHELGLAAGERGDRESAATLLDEASMMAGSVLPRAHPVRAATLYSRGLLFLAADEQRRAEKALDKALQRWSAAYPPDHPVHALGAAARAWVYARTGELPADEALGELDQATATLDTVRSIDPALLAQLHALRADLTAR